MQEWAPDIEPSEQATQMGVAASGDIMTKAKRQKKMLIENAKIRKRERDWAKGWSGVKLGSALDCCWELKEKRQCGILAVGLSASYCTSKLLHLLIFVVILSKHVFSCPYLQQWGKTELRSKKQQTKYTFLHNVALKCHSFARRVTTTEYTNYHKLINNPQEVAVSAHWIKE